MTVSGVTLISALFVLTVRFVPAQTTFALEKENYQFGETITATWTNGPGNPTDWVGIYPQGIVPDGNPGSTDWRYVNGTTTATTPRIDGSVTFPGTFPAGNWTAHFLANDGYTPITSGIDFTVTDPSASDDLVVVTDAIRRIHGIVGETYDGSLSAYARSGNGEVSFAKESGPAWLTLSSTGDLSGTPGPGDEGTNRFEVTISDGVGQEKVTLTIPVFQPGLVDPPDLKVLSFNIWVGTSRVPDGYFKGLDSIILSDADVIAICENSGRAAQWASDLGWHVFQSGGDNAILSRYPLIGTFTASHAVGATVRLADSPRRDLHFWSCHLTAYPYGPYDARDASGNDDNRRTAALAAEINSGRLAQINDILTRAQSQIDQADTEPFLLLGDFNCPSHLDWTPETAEAGMHYGLSIDWPVTLATEEALLVDAFRVRHPDPVAMPGNTWTPIDPSDVQDRIDMIHFKGKSLSTRECKVFTTLESGRWPSDHAGVLADFAITPVDEDGDGLSDSWEKRNFGDLESFGPDDDPDGDSLNNLFERSFALNPIQSGDPSPVRSDREGGQSVLCYRRLSGGRTEEGIYRARGLAYHLEASTDFITWKQADDLDVVEIPPESLGEGIEEAKFTIRPGHSAIRYFRVRVQ